MQEIWKEIKGYEKYYLISNKGQIKSKARIRNNQYSNKDVILKQTDDGHGYLQVTLIKENKRKTYKVHRLVAETFLDKNSFKFLENENVNEIDKNKLQVNHIKEFEKHNNNVDNLEWCTRKYNTNYGTRNERVNSWKNGRRKV